MSTTTTINPVNSGNSADGRKKAAAFAATAAAAAGLGVAGTHIVSGFEEAYNASSGENTISDSTLEETAQPDGGAANTSTAATSADNPSVASSEAPSTNNIVEPQPITNTDALEPGSVVEPDVITGEPDSTAVDTVAGDVVNPDEIAEAVISEVKVDPNDIDMPDIVNFDEIETVYTPDGERLTFASFHDDAGNDLVMVDVDGDNVLDVIMDYDGKILSEAPGNLSVGDVQEDIGDDDEYLAYDNELDNVDEYGVDSLAEDLNA